MNKIIDDYEPTPLTEEDKEFEKYCKLYEEKFGKRKKNEDLLDKILYPNFDENMEDGNLY